MTDDIFSNLRRSAFTTDPNTVPQDFNIGNGNPQPQGWTGAIATAAIADGSVTTAKIIDAAVTTAKINDGAVTFAKMGLPSSAQDYDATKATTTSISADANVVQLNPTATVTISKAPSMGDGRDGQQVVLLNVNSTYSITLRHQGAAPTYLPSSNLLLVAADITLGPRQSVRLMYSSTIGDWVQIGSVVAVL